MFWVYFLLKIGFLTNLFLTPVAKLIASVNYEKLMCKLGIFDILVCDCLKS